MIRGVQWTAPAVLLGIASWLVLKGLHFRPSGISNRLVDYSVAALMLPILLTALFSASRAFRYLLLSVWPTRVGVFAGADELILRLGPFGTHRYDTAQLDVRYPFELSADSAGGSFEAFLPKEEQFARFVPHMVHASAAEPINQVILRFVGSTETQVAMALRPVVMRWRAKEGIVDEV